MLVLDKSFSKLHFKEACSMTNNSQQLKAEHTTHLPKNSGKQNKWANKKPTPQQKNPKSQNILYLKSLSIWGYLRNLTVDPIYEIWITLEEKAILRRDEIRDEAVNLLSHFSVFTVELGKQYTPTLRSPCF